MRAAIRGIDIIHEGENAFRIAVIMLECNLNQNAILLAGSIENRIIQRLTAMIQKMYEFLDAALIVEGMLLLHALAQIGKVNFQPLCQKSRFAEPLLQHIIIKNGFLKNRIIRQKMHIRPCDLGFAHNSQRLCNIPTGIFLLMNFPIPMHLHHKPFGQRIYNRRTNAVQTAGNLISAAAEFTACMQNRKYHLQRAHAFLVIDINGNAAPVIHNGNGIIGVDFYGNLVTEPCKRFIHGVIYNFINQMMQTLCAGGADIHTGALSHRLQPFQNLNLICIIFRRHQIPLFRFIFSHNFLGKKKRKNKNRLSLSINSASK